MDTIAYYRNVLAQHGATYRGMDCGSAASHAARLRVLASMVQRYDETVLDVGCGVGHLIDYSTKIRKEHYRGIDRVPEMIATSRTRRPTWQFEVGDILQPNPEWAADYVLASGLFQFPSPWRNMMQAMFSLCRKGMACNFLRSGDVPESIAHPEEVLTEALAMTPWVTLRADYLPNDFTVFLYKEQP